MKIKSLEVENFKLFDRKFDAITDISKADLILLNGPNGYGKTTVFDALELALTGKIKRINTYNDELGVAKNETYERDILISDPSKEAYVMLTLEEGDCEIKLGRFYKKPSGTKCKKASSDNNPHKIFGKFMRRLYVNGEEIVQEEEQITILKNYHLYNIEEFFDKCCFLSQDEHLQFLKEAKKDKSMALEFLFQLPEEQKGELDRISDIISSLWNKNTKNNLGYITRLANREEQLNSEIIELEGKAEQNQASGQMENRTEYQCLFPGRGIKWDEKGLILKDDEFNEANRELENLIYYAQQKEACLAYSWNKPFWDLMKPFQGGEDIRYEDNALEYAYRYSSLAQKAEIFETRYHKQQQLEKLWQSLEKREIYKINWEIVSDEKLIEKDRITLVKEEIEQVKKLEKIQGTADKVITSILETRTVLQQRAGEAMEQGMIEDKNCPFCGAEYEERKILENKISQEKEKLLSLSEGISRDIQNEIDKIYEKYLNSIMEIVQLRLQDRVSEAIYKKCQEAKRYKGKLKEIKELLKKINISLPEGYQKNITEISQGYKKLIESIAQNLKKIPEDIEEQLTEKDFIRNYDKYYEKDEHKFCENTAPILKEKQNYLKKLFYDFAREEILKKRDELIKVQKRGGKLKEIYDDLCKYKKAIEEGIKDYKRSIIHAIEPLLHVYTAKILQQKFCGKSIFILTDENMKNFQLIHSAEDKHDILYNMSSGQLAAVSLSFLLCMHQVYAQQQSLPILLIDDPIQTIDDVNMVGLVDILRFEFNDAQIFISTHEQKFEWYLKYKYEKAGKKIGSYNMKNIVLQTDKIPS